MTEETASNFTSCWAILEIFGHQKYAGFVSVQTFGTASMFRLDVPALKERDRVSKHAEYVNRAYCPPGTTIHEGATEGYTKLFGVGAIYCLTPCTEEAALRAVEEIQPRPLMLISLPPDKAIAAGAPYVDSREECCDDCGKRIEYCDCP